MAGIHLFRWKELNLMLDVNSGAIHILDDISTRFIEKLRDYAGDTNRAIEDLKKEYSDDELREVAAELEAVHQAGAIFTEEDTLLADLSDLPIKAICLNVAHACNMKCRYCFASQGDFGMESGLMSLETGKRALDFLIEKSSQVKNLEVDFFGGEPLLNGAMLRELVQYGRQKEEESGKHFNFTLTTNALLLDDDLIDFVINNQISVILSLDGRPETNDRHRILNNGEGSYSLIVPNIKKMVEKNPLSYYIRGTFTRQNLDFSRDLQHIIDLGFDSVSLEPAVGPENEYSIREADLPKVLKEYEQLTDLLCDYQQTGKDVHFFHFNLDLQKGPCLAKRNSGCGAGVEYLVITPTGEIYPCHQFVGANEFLMGNIYDAQLDGEIQQRFVRNRLQDKEDCLRCWARYFCGGGCHANAYHSNGDMAKPANISCVMHRKRIEGAIYLEMTKKVMGNQG
ncbi:MAG: thioether cross-link-forming SCIFF peptide maturase [Firmicutes bacterium HGW-Firmicutes-15]|nr:MAG: thioether cross-link-forming SCIFF peptide maturase [Firmicutes bacterium HGW-Firmicutes-15]